MTVNFYIFISYIILFLLILFVVNRCVVTYRFAETGSERFDQFLQLLGEKIRLRGWDNYRGGLDVKGKCLKSFFFSLTYISFGIFF